MRPDHLARVVAAYTAELARTDTSDVLVVEMDGDVRVRVPAAAPAEVVAAIETLRADHAAVMTADGWRRAVAGVADGPVEVHGPVVHAFTDEPALLPSSSMVEQVAPWRLDRLRRTVGDGQWRDAGLDAEVDATFGLFAEPLDPPAWMARATPAARRTVVAAAAGVAFVAAGGLADVGVLTDPVYRGRGLATAVGAAAVDLAVRSAGVARWRAGESDAAAVAVGRRLGFADRARVLHVHLPGA